jgi:hypothetical protein
MSRRVRDENSTEITVWRKELNRRSDTRTRVVL